MANDIYDIITVGGGLGGSALAKAMAEHGARVRKGFQSLCFVGSAVCLVLLSATTSQWLALVYITLGLGFVATSAAGFLVNHLDIGPRYAGILMGITNTVGTIPGILAPVITGFIIKFTGSWDESW